jgi:hypothetical protein
MSETITTVCAHAGMVLCARAEMTELDALENAPEEAVPSKCGRASIWLMAASLAGGGRFRIVFDREDAELSTTVDGTGGTVEPLRRRVAFRAMVSSCERISMP